ncbi:MAG: hypothetical protein DLM57_08050 [Pseudonocardiales bacterium]|nr:MAG: hypothetical protein DLM57_08050 [Pseudonocardiales bacterium]
MTTDPIIWRQLYWPTPLEPASVTALLHAWASDGLVGSVALEVRADGRSTRWLVGARQKRMTRVLDAARSLVPGLTHAPTSIPVDRARVDAVRRLRLTTKHQPLRDEPELTARAIFAALARVNPGEEVVLQVVLGPRHESLVVPASAPASVVQPWWQAVAARPGKLDADRRRALQAKVGTYGFSALIRLGVKAATPTRRQSLLMSLFSGLRTADGPGAHLRLTGDNPLRLAKADSPMFWPLKLNVVELTSLLGAPIGKDLPGLPGAHPKVIAPTVPTKRDDFVIANATAPGGGQLGYSIRDASQHSWILGPNGTGKSTLLLNLATQYMEHGHALVVIEPKDLIADILTRVPESRRNDVILIDPSDREAAVGFNPLALDGRSPDLVADTILGVFHQLYADSWGPRTADVLHNGVLTLTRAGDASLVMLPLILTNAAFRRTILKKAGVLDPLSTGPFWSWFDALSDAERAQVIAPVMNKVRPWLIRPGLRWLIGQAKPRITIRQAIEQRKIVLVRASKGTLGPEGAQLLAALVLSELWQAVRERVAVPANQRHPIMVMVDEAQDFLRLPTDLADVLATSRSLGAYFHLAHQYRDQLPSAMRAAFESNARSRIAFQLSATDANAMAAGQSMLAPEDFTSLPAYHVYASLMRDGHLTPWASGRTLPPPAEVSDTADITRRSRSRYARPVSEVEADLLALVDSGSGGPVRPPTTSGRVRRNAS